MAKSSKLRVMISSRCNDAFPAGASTNLSDIRRQLKTEIEAMEIAGRKTFEVWISEEADPQGGTWDSWDVCIEAVKDCDILIVLSNGNAGWSEGSGTSRYLPRGNDDSLFHCAREGEAYCLG